MLMPNAQEAQRLSGEGDVEAAALRLAAEGPCVVVKLGAEGALGRRRHERRSLVAARPRRGVEPVDATGAGDSFDAGFIAARLGGEGLAEALALGCACGALSTRAAGGTAGQPTLAEARSLRA